MRRWLVTGHRGQLGHDLMGLLGGQGEEVLGLDLPELDITDAGQVADAVAGRDIVVNAAAWTNVDGAEAAEAAAFAANAIGPDRLARACARSGATLVHVSTDYVFAGDASTPYAVDEQVAPRSAYGRTKAAGEWALAASEARAYLVRTAWVYGAHGNNFVKTIARLAAERETLSVVDDQRGSPTYSAHLARSLVALARSGAEPGTYHCTGGGDTTWYGFTQAIFAELGLDPARVLPTTTGAFPRPAPRPSYSVLSDRAWREAGLPPMPHWRDALAEALSPGGALRASLTSQA